MTRIPDVRYIDLDAFMDSLALGLFEPEEDVGDATRDDLNKREPWQDADFADDVLPPAR